MTLLYISLATWATIIVSCEVYLPSVDFSENIKLGPEGRISFAFIEKYFMISAIQSAKITDRKGVLGWVSYINPTWK